MLFSSVAVVLSALSCVSAVTLPDRFLDTKIARGLTIENRDLDYAPSKLSRRADSTCLDSKAVQTGSAQTGQSGDAVTAGQVNSATDTANFINFCSGQTLTNGLQTKTGSCNGIVMGKIPATTNMVSSIIINPAPGQAIAASTTFNIVVQMQGLTAGSFTNAQSTYYSAPQNLDSSGKIIGHTHVTVQDMGKSLTPSNALDPTTFAFFKGINDAGSGNGLLQATVTGGLPAGNYRVCTMSSSANHQPVLMPVAQRGAQDDCTKFTVGGGSASGSGTGTGTGTGTGAAATTAKGSAATTSATTAAAAATSAASSAGVTVKSGSLGGAAPAVTASGDSSRPFAVNGNTFVTAANAVARSCDIQFNTCADLANSGKLNGKTVSDCTTQKSSCTQG